MSDRSTNYLNEPRDERGRWTAGGATLASARRPEPAPPAPTAPPEPAPEFGNRQDYVRANAIGHLAPDMRPRIEAILGRGAGADLQYALRALASPADIAQLTLGEVRRKFDLPDQIGDAVLGDLRDAANGARIAVAAARMDDAASTLARALTALGPDRLASGLRAIKDGIDHANLRQLAQILQDEAGQPSERVSMVPNGHTVLNRMARNDTVLVSDVARAYAKPRHPFDDETIAVARSILDGTSRDPTGGATHFYSPRFQPREGGKLTGSEVGGGLEAVPGFLDSDGKQIKNYRPEWTKHFDEMPVPSVPLTIAKFYRQPETGRVR